MELHKAVTQQLPRSASPAGDTRPRAVARQRLNPRTRRRIGSILNYSGIIVWLLISLAPVAWIVIQSLKLPRDVFAIPPKWLFKPSLDAYRQLFADTGANFAHYLLNTIIVTVTSVAIAVLVSVPAAYSLTFLRVKRRALWLVAILLAAMLPPIVLLVPLYVFWKGLNLVDNPTSLAFTYAAIGVPFTIWMLRGFMLQIPRDLYEAARMDGAGHLVLLTRIVVPLIRSGVAAAAIFLVIAAWNELLFASMFTTENRTAPAGIVATLITDRTIAWGRLYAAATLVVVPIIIFTIGVQRHFVRGFTFGAVKG
ncbi:MAG: multiple sugar transport system permease protein [Frankiaceae bacterium]|jgi:multiple sugar transport system permease protein|nr:multiple sugar transport system permease protein [Frankiaceae bacterium]